MGSFPLTVTVTTMDYRSYKNPLNKASLRTVTGWGNDPGFRAYKGLGLKRFQLLCQKMGKGLPQHPRVHS